MMMAMAIETMTWFLSQVNKFKNRLVNILPFESSRVCLQPLRWMRIIIMMKMIVRIILQLHSNNIYVH